ADSRCPLGWAGCVKARPISPSWSPHFRGTPVVESQPRAGFCAGIPNRIREQHSTVYKFMKPTPQISQNRHTGFPLTDHDYQPTADPKNTAGRQITKLT